AGGEVHEAGAVQHGVRRDDALQPGPRVRAARRRPGEVTAAALLLGQDAIDVAAVDGRTAAVDARLVAGRVPVGAAPADVVVAALTCVAPGRLDDLGEVVVVG